MTDSILNNVKKCLEGILPEDDSFDDDLIIFINAAISKLIPRGIAPYTVTSSTDTWADYIGTDERLAIVKEFIISDVKMHFDPPSSAYVMSALQADNEENKFLAIVVSDEINEEQDE